MDIITVPLYRGFTTMCNCSCAWPIVQLNMSAQCWVLELGHTTPLARSVESRPHLREELSNLVVAIQNSEIESVLLILRQSR